MEALRRPLGGSSWLGESSDWRTTCRNKIFREYSAKAVRGKQLCVWLALDFLLRSALVVDKERLGWGILVEITAWFWLIRFVWIREACGEIPGGVKATVDGLINTANASNDMTNFMMSRIKTGLLDRLCPRLFKTKRWDKEKLLMVGNCDDSLVFWVDANAWLMAQFAKEWFCDTRQPADSSLPRFAGYDFLTKNFLPLSQIMAFHFYMVYACSLLLWNSCHL